MKILFYADTVFGFGGVQRVLAVIAKALSDDNDVTILSTDTDENLSMYGYDQSRISFDYIAYNGKKNVEYFDNLLGYTERVLSEQDIKYLKNNFTNLNGIQQIIAIKGFQQLRIDKYLEQADKKSMKHVSIFNKINNVITNVMGV